MIMKRMILTSLFMLLGACSTSGRPEQSPSDSYAQAHAAAVAAIELSAAKAHAWNTTDALLEQASAAAAAGDEERAIQLADKARIQAELAAKQADREAEIWEERVLSGN